MVKKTARRTRRTHTAAFKAQVALAALREDKTRRSAQAVRFAPQPDHRVAPAMLEDAATAFRGASADAQEPVDLQPLHAKIGQLTLENDFLRRLGHVHLLDELHLEHPIMGARMLRDSCIARACGSVGAT